MKRRNLDDPSVRCENEEKKIIINEFAKTAIVKKHQKKRNEARETVESNGPSKNR